MTTIRPSRHPTGHALPDHPLPARPARRHRRRAGARPTSTAPGPPSFTPARSSSRSAPPRRRTGTGRATGTATGTWARALPVDELAGLRPTATSSRWRPSSSTCAARPGRWRSKASFRDGRGAGLFTFAPRAAYVAEMKALGYTDDLPLWRRFQLAVHDVGPKYIRDAEGRGLRQADARPDSAREDARRHHRLHHAISRPRASRSRRSRSWCGRATTASPPSSSRR